MFFSLCEAWSASPQVFQHSIRITSFLLIQPRNEEENHKNGFDDFICRGDGQNHKNTFTIASSRVQFLRKCTVENFHTEQSSKLIWLSQNGCPHHYRPAPVLNSCGYCGLKTSFPLAFSKSKPVQT